MSEMNVLQTKSLNQDSLFIFLAEDDIDDQELLTEALNRIHENIRLEIAANGKKALAWLTSLPAENLPCLIILDYNLPEINGSEILKSLAELSHYTDVPKVVWSTSNSPLYERLCLELGASAYFVKPADIDGIERLAQKMLAFCSGK